LNQSKGSNLKSGVTELHEEGQSFTEIFLIRAISAKGKNAAVVYMQQSQKIFFVKLCATSVSLCGTTFSG
jgi:hypothetical protein